MTFLLVRKLLRDLRWSLLVVMLLLGAFQLLWAKITERILSTLSPFFVGMANSVGMSREDVEKVVFEGPGRVTRTLIGGESVQLDRAMDLLSVGYVHPLMQVMFCIWAIGRASGAIAGEIDRGTMELLLAQPLSRSRLILAHLIVDAVTIPLLCLGLWAGNWAGAWAVGEIKPKPATFKTDRPDNPMLEIAKAMVKQPTEEETRERLAIRPAQFGRALCLVGGLIFAVCGGTMWLSALGRYRLRVLGLAVLIVLLQFLVNLLGQMWDAAEWMRPLTIFYYYQPQQLILSGDWCVHWREWNGGKDLLAVPMPLVLYGVGAVGYVLAWRTLVRRDLPAPL
jgi:ABC-2 type transport system permease protein